MRVSSPDIGLLLDPGFVAASPVGVRTWTYTLTEHEPDKPWLIISGRRGMAVELDDRADFFEWSSEHWATDRYSVELDPYQM